MGMNSVSASSTSEDLVGMSGEYIMTLDSSENASPSSSSSTDCPRLLSFPDIVSASPTMPSLRLRVGLRMQGHPFGALRSSNKLQTLVRLPRSLEPFMIVALDSISINSSSVVGVVPCSGAAGLF